MKENIAVVIETKRFICKKCKSELTYRPRFGDFYSCEKCDCWTSAIVIKEKSYFDKKIC